MPQSDRSGRSKTERQQKRKARITKNTSKIRAANAQAMRVDKHTSHEKKTQDTMPVMKSLMRTRDRMTGSGTGILFEEPNPTGSRPSDLIGLYRVGKGDPNRRKGAAGKGGGRQGLRVYSRGKPESNRAPIAKATQHGIGRDPFARA